MNARAKRLMPNGIPRWIRIYDNGGETADRYCVVYTGNYNTDTPRLHHFVTMSPCPYSPLGVCIHDCDSTIIDSTPTRWGGVKVGSTHPVLGKRIKFDDLNEDCKRVVLEDYESIWNITGEVK